MQECVKYYWCSIAFTLSAFVSLLVNSQWISLLFIILSILSLLFGILIEKGEFDD